VTLHPTASKVQERLTARGLDVEVVVLPDSTRTAAEAAAACGCEVGQIVKSLVFMVDGEPTMILCAGDRRVTRIDGEPASAEQVRDATGFSIGGVPPLAHDSDLPTLVDESLRSRCSSTSSWCTSSACSAPSSSGEPTRGRRSGADAD
jgi:prolyl-tRNA editing enzyme YbaK/EbsC (Cys-tRNA(Pro) deacylase)